MTDLTPEYGPDTEGCMWRFSDDRWQWYDGANDEWDDADSMDMADLIPVLAAKIERLTAALVSIAFDDDTRGRAVPIAVAALAAAPSEETT